MERALWAKAIRQGLMLSIPVLMIGSLALVLRYLPIGAYQTFLESFLSGALQRLFEVVNSATFGLLSVYITFTISLSYARLKDANMPVVAAVPALCCFALLSGLLGESGSLECLGVKGMFTAVFCGLLATALFCRLIRVRRFTFQVYSEGANTEFNRVFSCILPAAIVIVLFAVGDALLSLAFQVSGFNHFFERLMNGLFAGMGRSLFSGLLFVFLSSFLWFFGIHGSDVLESVSENLFAPGVVANAQALAAGGQPTEIVSKTFIDVFVLMGGCGAALCLLLAILLFGKQRNVRQLARVSAVPMAFNINEMMVFGLPVVLNPVFFLPFLLTPLVCALTSYAAMALGLVPLPVQEIEWVTPVVFGGYLATGSVAGSVLQVVNLAIGVLLYKPFLRMYENIRVSGVRRDLAAAVQQLQQEERTGEVVSLLDQTRSGISSVSKMLVEDLRFALSRDDHLMLYYQPQFDNKGCCIGAEALLRWNHSSCGFIYPPVIVRLARESGQLDALERKVFSIAGQAWPALRRRFGEGFKLSVNICAHTLLKDGFVSDLEAMVKDGKLPAQGVCVEVTEQETLLWDDAMEQRLQRIHDLGFALAVDDFSMGHTSLKYLQTNQFDLVKLDGGIVRNMLDNPRCESIISSIVHLSHSMDFEVLAEFVETQEQRQRLEDLGCTCYQGYLYSPAVPLAELLEQSQLET